MSAIATACLFDPGETNASPASQAMPAMLAAMRSRGVDVSDVQFQPSVALGVVRHSWELRAGVPTGILCGNGLSVAADASLYYREDLCRKLSRAGQESLAEESDAELILRSYVMFGERCVEHLEGDFAFVLWDAVRRRLFAARSFDGRRALFHARGGPLLVLASTVGGVLAAPGVSREISLATVATVASGIWGHSHETGFRAITELPAGHRLLATVGGPVTVERFWSPPSDRAARPSSSADAAAELRELLARAVEERLSPDGVTAVSLSGGWDSPSVFGAGQLALAASTSGRTLKPVSISYPAGDPGREDELIDAIAAHWQSSPAWIAVDDIPMFGDPAGDAAARDEPFAHAYEQWNRELSRGARRVGARVILDGIGGDQLFQVSDIYLADLVRSGRWLESARQWRSRGGKGWKQFYLSAVRPAMPAWATATIASMRGMRPPAHYLDREPPPWLRTRFLDEHGVLEREKSGRPRHPARNLVMAESHAYLLFPFFARIMRLLRGFGLEEGVEVRSPLLDERVVRFALERPWHERADGGETKVLLRRAMRGALPEHVLAPRTHRTGTTSAYFVRQLLGPGRRWLQAMADESLLASIGMVDQTRLRRAWDHFLANGDEALGADLYFTFQADLWLRARTS